MIAGSLPFERVLNCLDCDMLQFVLTLTYEIHHYRFAQSKRPLNSLCKRSPPNFDILHVTIHNAKLLCNDVVAEHTTAIALQVPQHWAARICMHQHWQRDYRPCTVLVVLCCALLCFAFLFDNVTAPQDAHKQFSAAGFP